MIISRTPFRISFFGGGSDYAPWFREHGGQVIGTTIDKYCYLSVRPLPPFFEHRNRIVWSKIEMVNSIDEIEHPTVRAVLSQQGFAEGLEITHQGDLPARSGLGSSSSFTTGLLNVLMALKGRSISKRDLANEAIRIEQEVMKEAVGSQDQVWAAYGGLNRIQFNADGTYMVSPLIVSREKKRRLAGSLMLFFTGISRSGVEIAARQIDRLEKHEVDLHAVVQLVDEAARLLEGSDDPTEELGRLMHEAWMMKRTMAVGVTTPHVDDIYQAGLDAGAIGGKLLGAGGGGFLLFVVPPERQARVKERLSELVHVTFDFENEGSRIVVYDADGYSGA